MAGRARKGAAQILLNLEAIEPVLYELFWELPKRLALKTTVGDY